MNPFKQLLFSKKHLVEPNIEANDSEFKKVTKQNNLVIGNAYCDFCLKKGLKVTHVVKTNAFLDASQSTNTIHSHLKTLASIMGKRLIHTLFNAQIDLFDYDIEQYCLKKKFKKKEQHLFIICPKQDCKIIARKAKLTKTANGNVTVIFEGNNKDDGRRSFDAILVIVHEHKAVHFVDGIGEVSRKSTKLDEGWQAGTSKVEGA